jgi:hypothetical protein
MEFLVVIPDIDERTKDVWREDHLESLAILLDGVHEAQAPEAVQLELVLDLDVLLWVFKVLLCFFFLGQSWAVVHQDLADDVRSMESNLDVVRIVERQVGQCRQYRAHDGRSCLHVFQISRDLDKELKQNRDYA